MSLYRVDSSKSNDSYHHDNEIENLRAELENERSYRDNIKIRNAELEKDILKLQEQLQKVDFPWEHDDNLRNELLKIDQINGEINILKEKIPEMKEKLKNAKVCGKDCRMKHDDLNINLDIMNEIELLKTIKRLERMKTDIKSALISKEWTLDNESKLHQRIIDQKMSLQNSLYHTNTTPSFKANSSLEHWKNGGITQPKRTLDLKRGPINPMVLRGKLPLI